MRSTNTMVRGIILLAFLLMPPSLLQIMGCGSTQLLERRVEFEDTTYVIVTPEETLEAIFTERNDDNDKVQIFEGVFVRKADAGTPRQAGRVSITLPNDGTGEAKGTLTLFPDSIEVSGKNKKVTEVFQKEPNALNYLATLFRWLPWIMAMVGVLYLINLIIKMFKD